MLRYCVANFWILSVVSLASLGTRVERVVSTSTLAPVWFTCSLPGSLFSYYVQTSVLLVDQQYGVLVPLTLFVALVTLLKY